MFKLKLSGRYTKSIKRGFFEYLYLGEYVRHYSRGKNVLEQLGGKTLVMTLLSHEDPNVRLVMIKVVSENIIGAPKM